MFGNASIGLRLPITGVDLIRLSSLLLAGLLLPLCVTTAGAQYQGTDLQMRIDVVGPRHFKINSSGHLRVVGLTVMYRDDKYPTEDLSLTCDEFAARSRGLPRAGFDDSRFDINVDAEKRYRFSFPNPNIWNPRNAILADCNQARAWPAKEAEEAEEARLNKERRIREAEEARQRGAREAEEARERTEMAAVAARARGAQEAAAAARFKSEVLSAWNAAEEPSPFTSIRGDFDLSGSSSRQWKTSLYLQNAEKCGLIKTPLATPKSASAWTYACSFHSAGDGYEGMVKSLQAILNLPFQPDERAANINQVFFADPSKPARRLFVAKINAATFGVSVVSVRFAGIAPGRLNAEAFTAVPTMLPAEPTAPAAAAKVVPVQKQPATDNAACAAYLQQESERTSRQLDVSRLQNELNDLQARYQTATQQALQSQQLADANSLAGIGQKGWGSVLNATSTAVNANNAQQFKVDAQNLQVQMNLKQSELIAAQIAASAPPTAPPPGCAGGPAAQVNGASATAEPAETTAHDEVEKIRSGTYAPMPPAERTTTGSAVSGRTTMTVQNSTAYQLSVFYDGPVSMKLNLAPGASQTIDLAPGAFHIAGRVSAADVLPFYGEETYAGSASYSATFYIR